MAAAQVNLSQEPGRRVVARSQIPRERIAREPTWRSFFFDPILGSAGQRYVIVIQAVDNDPEEDAHLPPEFEAGDAIRFDQWFVHPNGWDTD